MDDDYEGRAGPHWNLDRPCLSLSSHSYKLSSRATETCKETVPDRWVTRGATVLTVAKTPTPGCSRSLSVVQPACPHQVGTSQYAGASVVTEGVRWTLRPARTHKLLPHR